jgi:hypothetical protein
VRREGQARSSLKNLFPPYIKAEITKRRSAKGINAMFTRKMDGASVTMRNGINKNATWWRESNLNDKPKRKARAMEVNLFNTNTIAILPAYISGL